MSAEPAGSETGPGETGPFVPDYLLYLLAAASAAASGAFHEHVKRSGLRPVEWRVLACLRDADGQPTTTLARTTLFEQSRLTRIVDQMAGDGLVRREADPEDRRRVRVFLTEKGLQVAEPLLEDARRHERALLDALAPADRRRIKGTLRSIAEAAEAGAAGAGRLS